MNVVFIDAFYAENILHIGPKFMKWNGYVLYRQIDIEACEKSCAQISIPQGGVAHVTPIEIISHWIDAQPEGALIKGQGLAHLVKRDQATRQLARLARQGRLMRVARGVYVAVAASRFGPVPPPVYKVVQSLAVITEHAIVRHGAAAANALGLTTQVPVRQVYLTNGRARTLSLGKQIIEIRHAPNWMLVLGDSLAGDVVRALEWVVRIPANVTAHSGLS